MLLLTGQQRRPWAATDFLSIHAMSHLITALWWLMLPFVVITAIALWATETQPQRIKRLHRSGQSQASIASRLNVSRYQVRKALAA